MHRPIFVMFLSTMLMAFSCVLLQERSDKNKRVFVDASWQDIMKNKIAAGPFTEGWAMLSESSMEDRGQVMIYFEKGKDYGWVEYVGRNSKKIDDQFKISGNTWSEFREKIKKDKLKDFSKSVYGIRYEYFHIIKDKGVVKEINHILMANPSSLDEGKPHSKLVEAFFSLVEKK